jgi:Conserved hypothetical protein 2217 (DUF2460)
MAMFPILKTKAVAQYPAGKAISFQNQVLRFVDGMEQRYRDSAGPLHRWVIALSELDESEMAAVEIFFAANQGRFGNFAFTDPWDGTQYPNCSLQADELAMNLAGEMRGKTSLTVVENRG